MKLIVCIFALALAGFAQESQTYGMQAGTLAASFGVGGAHVDGLSGVHPALLGSFDVGLAKYVGIFGEGGWMRLANIGACGLAVCGNVSADGALAGGGLEIVASNSSRVVPYFKAGGGYLHNGVGANLSGVQVLSASLNHASVLGGGGVRVYVTHRLGVDGQVRYIRSLGGNNGGNNYLLFTVGVIGHIRN